MPSAQIRQTTSRTVVFAIAGLLTLVVGVYGVSRLASRGEILGSVVVLDVELGGITPQEAAEAVVDLEGRLANLPARARIDGTVVDILPTQTGFRLDTETVVQDAMDVGRSGNPVADFFWWLRHLTTSTHLVAQGTVDSDAFEELLDGFDSSVIGEPPFEGAVELEDGVPVARYPRSGRRIDRSVAETRLVSEFLRLNRQPVELPVRDEEPDLSPADVDHARNQAELMLSAPVVLAAEDGTVLTFGVEDLRQAFTSTTHRDPPAIELGFDSAVVDARLAEVRPEFESPPIDARFEIDGYEVSIVEGRSGTLLDAEETAEILAATSLTSLRRADLPLQEGAEPDVTTEQLEALNIRHLVAEFTTYHDCCAARVTNIQLMADEVDGAVVAPGETFSLNEYVGRRTEEDGYLPAGTIIGGEIVDTVGGGVSQFATTFYNAVFWGGYEDVEHKAHSFYFSRYPEGIEATISWPLPDLVFHNNDESGVLIRTTYTDSSITVKFYGDNDDRILSGDQAGGNLSVAVVAEGGPEAKQVSGDRSERQDFRSPPDPLYRGDPELDIDEERVVQQPADGWTVVVTRTITVGEETTTETWPVRYLPKQEIIEVHPCQVPNAQESCPTTTTSTTTTTTATTTTTTTPETTTTIGSPTTTTGG